MGESTSGPGYTVHEAKQVSLGQHQFKPWPFSSHMLLIQEFEIAGQNRWVLDLGCGRGYLARILTERGYQVVGVDGNADDLQEAGKWCRRVIRADLDSWIGPDNRQLFSYILMSDVLEHLREPAVVLQRLKSLLDKHGVFVLSVPNVAHLYVRQMLLRGRWDYAERGIMDRTHLHFFTRASFQQCLLDSGIVPYSIRPVILPWPFILGDVPKPIMSTLVSLDQLAVRLRPTLFAYQWIVSGGLR